MGTAWIAAAMTTTALLLTSCTSSPSTDAQRTARESTSPTPIPSTTGRSGHIEARFLNRIELPSCGTLDIPLGARRPLMAEELLDCLKRADRDVGAELLVVTYSDEGDPTHTYYRREPEHYGYLVNQDTTRDDYGPKRWWTYECDGLGLSGDNIDCLVE